MERLFPEIRLVLPFRKTNRILDSNDLQLFSYVEISRRGYAR